MSQAEFNCFMHIILTVFLIMASAACTVAQVSGPKNVEPTFDIAKDMVPVSMTVCNVRKYVDAANAVGVELTEVLAQKNWSFHSGGGTQMGFSHTPKDWSKSHSECNFTASFSNFQDFKFAGRMAAGTTYRMK